MKARRAHIANRNRPQWGSALLSLLVVLSLIAPPSHLCGLLEAAPGHSHSSGHSHTSHEAASGHAVCGHGEPGHNDGDYYDDDQQHAGVTHHHSSGASVSSLPGPTTCCSDGTTLAVVASTPARFLGRAANATGLTFMPATVPLSQSIIALSHCYGRDGPPGSKHLPQLSCASLLGRAPPTSA